MQEQAKQEDTQQKETESWIQKKWRPMMAVMYMCVCAADFILFPIMFTIVQFWETQAANDAFRQWAPLTLQGGGLFHMAMGAVLGITAWSRGQEKMAGASTPVVQPAPQMSPPQYNSPQYQPNVSSYSSQPNYAQPQPVTGYNGKMAPAQHFPEI